MNFRLRYLQHQLELGLGDFLIGRSPECQLSLDDALVSRRHALLTIARESVLVRDLGSRNGVLVNGDKIEDSLELVDGDCLTIGSQNLTLNAYMPARLGGDGGRSHRPGAQTLTAMQEIPDTQHRLEPIKLELSKGDPAKQESSKRMDALRLLAALADKALALGRAEEAERILSSVMTDVFAGAQSGVSIGTETIDTAGRYAIRLASATNKGSWVDYVIKLYASSRRPCPAPIIDELYTLLRKVSGIDRAGLRAYVALMQHLSASHGPAERFLVQRIEGLERLAALR